MAHLGNERGEPLGPVELPALGGGVEVRNENARSRAGVREDLQQLLLGDDGHAPSFQLRRTRRPERRIVIWHGAPPLDLNKRMALPTVMDEARTSL